MESIINIIICFILIWISLRLIQFKKKGGYAHRQNLKFIVLVTISSFFFGSNSLVFLRIGVWFCVFLLFIWQNRKERVECGNIISFFFIFYVWLIFTFLYTKGVYEGGMMLVKYATPIIGLVFAYHILDSEQTYLKFLMIVNKMCVIYICINGISPIGHIVSSIIGKSFFDGSNSYQMGALVAIPICLYYITGKKKYLLHACFYMLPPFTYIRRAAILGYASSFFITIFYKYRLKSLWILLVGGVLFLQILFASENMRTRFFGGDKGAADISIAEIQEGNLSDHINSSGRDAMWTFLMNRFYNNNPIAGCGLGTVKHFMSSSDNIHREYFMLVHNDYLQLLCETGIIGISLYALFAVQMFCVPLSAIKKPHKKFTRLSAIIALASFVSVSLFMYFTNMLSTPLVMWIPYLLMGMHLKLRKLETLTS